MADRRGLTSHSGTSSRSRTTKDSKSTTTKQGTLMAPLDGPSVSRPSTSKSTSVSRTPHSTGTRMPSTATSSSRTTKGTVMPQLDPSKPKGESSRSHRRTSTTTPSRPTPSSPSAPRLQTRYTSTHDIQMASRQSKIDTLSASDRQEQEKWALSKLTSNTGACLDGYGWTRKNICWDNVPGGFSGYICQGGAHFVTDELIAKGNGKCYLLWLEGLAPLYMTAAETWFGPYGEREIWGIFGDGSREEYARRFGRGFGKVGAQELGSMRIVRSVYSREPFPSHLMDNAKFFG